MCGINGIYGLERLKENPREIVSRMNKALEHRGPDASGVEVRNTVALGHQRLSIIDLEKGSNQPFVDTEKGLYLAFNGEIYNYRELRKELSSAYNFKTSGDTEVIVAAYAKWGQHCVHKFNGMFAFALWDENEETLWLCRDRLGIKPLYYGFEQNTLVFSSEIRAILASGILSQELSSKNISEYLYYQTTHLERTIFESIYQLEAGHSITLREGEVRKDKWWSPNPQPIRISKQEATTEIHRLLQDAVKERLVADVPFGAFLSGGIDSSLLVGLMQQQMSNPVKTFNVSFDEQEFSEAKYAQEIARRFGTSHTEIKLNPNDLLNILPDALAAMDHPSGDGPNTFLISKVTRQQGVKMVLSGLGGDELFAGYPVFRQLSALQQKKWLLSFPKVLRWLAGTGLKSYKRNSESEKIHEVLMLDYFDVTHAYPLSRKVLSNSLMQHYFRSQSATQLITKHLKDNFEFNGELAALPFLSRISWAELSTYLNATLLRDTDQMSMAHALEVRVPFLDHRLVNFCLQLPDGLKFGKYPKQLLLDSFPDLLPKSIYNRPKMGFTFPWGTWMRKELKPFIDENIHWLSQHPLFSDTKLPAFYALFQAKDQRVPWSRIWHLVVLSAYLQQQKLS